MPTEFLPPFSVGRPLLDLLKQTPDPRHRHGKRHPLHALLELMCVAALCGYKSYSAMAEWGRHYDAEFLRKLGITRENRLVKRVSAPCYVAWTPRGWNPS